MIDLNIDESKLKVKYVLGNYIHLSDFPTTEDVSYLIIDWLRLNNSLTDTEFSDNTLRNQYEINKDIFDEKLKELEKKGIIEIQKELKTRNVYKLIKNPFLTD